jgi:hypothetical protein
LSRRPLRFIDFQIPHLTYLRIDSVSQIFS